MFESYYEGLVWIIIEDISWLLVLLLGTLLTNLVKRFQIYIYIFFFICVLCFCSKDLILSWAYNLWKFNALFVYKNFQCYPITWMLFSYQVVLLLLCGPIHMVLFFDRVCNWGTLLTNLVCGRFQFFLFFFHLHIMF